MRRTGHQRRARRDLGACALLERFGLGGRAIAVLITDSSPLPLTAEPLLLLLAVRAGLPLLKLGAVACSASVLAGWLGYGCGGLLLSRGPLRRAVEERAPGGVAFLRRHGVRGVALAALLPIPFAPCTWSAGLLRLGFRDVALAYLLRVPKTGFYLALLSRDWLLGGS